MKGLWQPILLSAALVVGTAALVGPAANWARANGSGADRIVFPFSTTLSDGFEGCLEKDVDITGILRALQPRRRWRGRLALHRQLQHRQRQG